MSGRDVTRTNVEAGGGSSSVFSSAFCALALSDAALSMMPIRRSPSDGRRAAREFCRRRFLVRGLERPGIGVNHDPPPPFERAVCGALNGVAHLIDLDR